MIKIIGGLLDRIFAVIGALLFSQVPVFMQQYTQRLAGHVAELSIQIEKMRQAASLTGKTLQQYVQKFMSASDPDFARQGVIMNEMTHRWQNLSEGLTAMQNASAVTRPFAFGYHLNLDIFKNTFQSFDLGLVFTVEGFIYALIGIAAGYLAFWSIRKLGIMLLNVFTFPFKARNEKT